VGEAQRGRHHRHERAAASEHDQERVVTQQRLEPVSDPAARLDDGRVAEQSARLVAIGSDDADGRSPASRAPSASTMPSSRSVAGASSVPPGVPYESIGTPTTTDSRARRSGTGN
jgi:hypothetical protein